MAYLVRFKPWWWLVNGAAAGVLLVFILLACFGGEIEREIAANYTYRYYTYRYWRFEYTAMRVGLVAASIPVLLASLSACVGYLLHLCRYRKADKELQRHEPEDTGEPVECPGCGAKLVSGYTWGNVEWSEKTPRLTFWSWNGPGKEADLMRWGCIHRFEEYRKSAYRCEKCNILIVKDARPL